MLIRSKALMLAITCFTWGTMANAQTFCGVSQTINGATTSTFLTSYFYGYRGFSASLYCTGMPNNVALCIPSGTASSRTRGFASIMTTDTPAVTKFCDFSCSNAAMTQTCSFRVDTVDGLPVELMDFGVDGP